MMLNRKEKSGRTIERILAAARKVFAEKGYSGARIDEIAQRAQVNKATIYYQIGDKDTLYAHVIHQVIASVAQGLAEAVSRAQSPKDKLKVYITFIADAVDKNPDLPPIMMREIASGGATLPQVVAQDVASVLKILTGILKAGEKTKEFVETVPFLIHMMIMGTILFYKKAAPIKDKQTWIPKELKTLDKPLEDSLGEAVATLVLKAIGS